MNRFFILLVVSTLFMACIPNSLDTSGSAHLEAELTGDSSNLLMYKGVFTTFDSEYRATVDIRIPIVSESGDTVENDGYPEASIYLHTGEVHKVYASKKVFIGEQITELEFSSPNLSFLLSFSEYDVDPVIKDAQFNTIEASILIAKHTLLAPVTPITGTYSCINCNGHPNLDTGMTQTFNMMFTVADGEGAMTTQTLLGTTEYIGIGYQDGCSPNGTITYCDINSGDGSTTTVGYLSNGNPVYWSGNHIFNNEPTANGNDCSGIYGGWSWESNSYGILTGQFSSDVNCFQTLYFEDFNAFTAAGFSPTPIAGQLDSDVIIATGFSDGSLNYGDTATTGDFARGIAAGNITTGGVYALDAEGFDEDFNPMGISLTAKPEPTDFTPGTFEFKIENATGNILNNFRVSYKVYATNGNTDKSNSIKFSYSTDGSTFNEVPELDYTSPEISVVTGGFPPEIPIFLTKTTFFSGTVAPGSFIYLRVTGDEISGSGGSDALLIDDVMLEGI